jgi:hypothetical protein
MITPKRSGKSTLLKVASILLTTIPLFSAQADAATREVDCDKGQSLEAAVMKGQGSAEHLYIDVSGYCDERVTIERDDVSIAGDNGATVQGFNIEGARRITLNGITVTGPETGIMMSSADVKLENVLVTGNGEDGILSRFNSTLRVSNSNITNNGVNGIGSLGGTLDISENSTISGNANHGIDADLHCSVMISDTAIMNNDVFGIQLGADSGLLAFGGLTVSGNEEAGVFCGDTESSYLNHGEPIDDSVECTDFNQVAP